jgi:hypothetical protein
LDRPLRHDFVPPGQPRSIDHGLADRRLEKQKAAFDVVVIDRVPKEPTAD